MRFLVLIAALSLPVMFTQNAYAQNYFSRFKSYTVDDGLSQNTGFSIEQDTVGFLWVGTQLGLSRFDGHNFKNYYYGTDDSTSLSAGWVTAIHIDQQGAMWVGTRPGGLHRYNQLIDSFEHYDLAQRISGVKDSLDQLNEIWSVEQTSENEIWVGTEGGLVLFNPIDSSARLIQYGQQDSTRVKAIQKTVEGDLWIGDENGIVARVWQNPDSTSYRVEVVSELETEVNAFLETKNGSVLLSATSSGIYRYDTIQERIVPYLTQYISTKETINVLHEDVEGNLWFGSNGSGLYYISESGEFKHYTYRPNQVLGLPNNSIYEITSDASGIVWVGTWNGVMQVPRLHGATELYLASDEYGGLADGSIMTIAEDELGMIWLGKFGGGITLFDIKSKLFSQNMTMNNSGLCGNSVMDLLKVEHQLWIATHDKGVCQYDTRTNAFTHFQPGNSPFSISDTSALSLLMAPSGELMIGMRDHGLSVLDSTGIRFTNLREGDVSGLLGDYVWPIIMDEDSTYWMGVFDKGIMSFDLDQGQFSWLDIPYQSVLERKIYDLYQDSRKNLWAATDAGARRIDLSNREVTTFTVDEGLPHNSIRGIVEDDLGYVWFTTNAGLSRYNPSQNSFRNYFIEDGLQGDRYHARSALKASDGRLFFGGSNGFQIIDPKRIEADSSESNLVLTEIRVNNELYLDSALPTHLTRQITLEPGEDRLQVSFSLLNFSNGNNLTYRYRLLPPRRSIGLLNRDFESTEWEDIGNRNYVNLQFEGYGRYRLRIEALGKERGDLIRSIALPVHVKTPWHKQAWFRILLVLAGMGVITAIIAVRLRHQLNIERLRVRLAKKLHDDINGDLSTIGKRIRILKKRLDPQGTDLKHMALMGEMVQGMGDAVRDNTWLIDTKEDTLKTLVEKMKSLAHMKLDGNIPFTFHHTPELVPDVGIKLDFKQNIFLLYKECLNNITKYAHASKVGISIVIEGDRFALVVSDDGVGFDEDKIRKGDGLENMEFRARQVKATYAIKSSPGQGTRISLSAPIQKKSEFDSMLRRMARQFGLFSY